MFRYSRGTFQGFPRTVGHRLADDFVWIVTSLVGSWPPWTRANSRLFTLVQGPYYEISPWSICFQGQPCPHSPWAHLRKYFHLWSPSSHPCEIVSIRSKTMPGFQNRLNLDSQWGLMAIDRLLSTPGGQQCDSHRSRPLNGSWSRRSPYQT